MQLQQISFGNPEKVFENAQFLVLVFVQHKQILKS